MIFSLFHAFTYSQIGSVYPRSGADYVFSSRNLTAVGGFVSNFTLSIFSGLVAGSLIAWIPSTLMYSYFKELSVMTGYAYLSDWASFATSPIGVVSIGTVATLISLGIMLMSSRRIVDYLKYSFYLAMVAWAIILVSLAVSNSSSFISNWNKFMGANNYQLVIPTATSNGLTYSQSPIVASVAGLIMGFWIFYGYYIPTFFSGEVKRAPRTLLIGSFGSLIFMWALFVGGAILLGRLVSTDWLGAEGYLFYGKPGLMSANPFISFYAAVAYPNVALAVIVFVGFLLSLIGLAVTYFYYVSRNIFAWSFDRIVPEKLSAVRPNGSPWVAVITIAILAEIGLALSAYTTIFVQINFILFAVLTMLVPVFTAIIFPFKNREAFEKAMSYAKSKIGGVPLMTLIGIITFAYLLWMIYASYAYPAVGGYITSATVETFLSVVIAGIVIYYVAKYYRKRSGLDLALVYKSIPPE